MADYSIETYLIRNHKFFNSEELKGYDRVEEVRITCDFDMSEECRNHFLGMKRLKRFKVLSKKSRFYTEDGVLFAAITTNPNDEMREKEMFWDLPENFYGKVLVAFPTDYPGRKYVVPDGTRAIAKGAFSETTIEELTLPDSLRYIGLEAFSFTRHLEMMRVPDNRHIVQINQMGMGKENRVAFECNNGMPLNENVLHLWNLCLTPGFDLSPDEF